MKQTSNASKNTTIFLFYYPYYDYKFPDAIYTTESMRILENNAIVKPGYDQKRFSFFDEEEVWRC